MNLKVTTMKRKLYFALLLLLLLLPVIGAAQANKTIVAPTTLADITGTGAAVQVQSSGTARWVLFVAPTTNSAVVRVGDSSVSTTRGAPMAAGGSVFYPPITTQVGDQKQPLYNLSAIYVYIANGDKVSIQWSN